MSLEEALPYLAGGLAIPVLHWVKGALNISGKVVVVLAVIISGALAFGAIWFFGEGFDLMADGAKAFAAATVIYKLLPDSLFS